MKKYLIILIFIIFFTSSDVSLAISPPGGLSPCNENDVSLAPLFEWNAVSGTQLYWLLYKRTDQIDWVDIYISSSVSKFQVTGLSPEKDYHWYVVACADDECNNSAASGICNFTTQEIPPPDDDDNGFIPGIPFNLENPIQAKTLEEALENLIKFLFFLIMALAPVFIIYAAFLILASGGDSAKVNQGRRIIFWVAVAVAVAVVARGFVAMIKGLLGG